MWLRDVYCTERSVSYMMNDKIISQSQICIVHNRRILDQIANGTTADEGDGVEKKESSPT